MTRLRGSFRDCCPWISNQDCLKMKNLSCFWDCSRDFVFPHLERPWKASYHLIILWAIPDLTRTWVLFKEQSPYRINFLLTSLFDTTFSQLINGIIWRFYNGATMECRYSILVAGFWFYNRWMVWVKWGKYRNRVPRWWEPTSMKNTVFGHYKYDHFTGYFVIVFQ